MNTTKRTFVFVCHSIGAPLLAQFSRQITESERKTVDALVMLEIMLRLHSKMHWRDMPMPPDRGGPCNNQSFGANAQASCAKAMKLRASLS